MDNIEKAIFNRTERLFGEEMMQTLSQTKVIIFGVGGVGSWCAEGLIRSGIGHLTIVDPDKVCITNVNRQLMATTSTVGRYKVDVLQERLLDINPNAEIKALKMKYSEETADMFELENYDYIIDAVDSLKDKAHLILRACETDAVFYSSMGAAVKVNPQRIKVAEFWEVRGCPLAAAIRKKFKKAGTIPSHKFLCVYDDEVLPNLGNPDADTTYNQEMSCTTKAVINGATAHITGIFGFTLSGLLIEDIYKKKGQQ